MDQQLGNDKQIDNMRRDHLSQLALGLADKVREAMLQSFRDGGNVPNAAVHMTCAQLANVAVDTVMQEMAVVQTTCRLKPDDVPPELRDATGQTIIDRVAAPRMAADIADAMVKSGLVRPSATIPYGGGVSITFAAWGLVLRQQTGPAAMGNVMRLDYGKGTSVFRSGAIGSAEGWGRPDEKAPPPQLPRIERKLV